MKNRVKRIGVILLVIFVLVVSIGCGSFKEDSARSETKTSMESPSNVKIKFNQNVDNSVDVKFDEKNEVAYDMDEATVDSVVTTGADMNSSSAGSMDILAKRKIIRNASIELEVEKFNNAYGQIQNLISGIGFIQESNVNKDYYYYKSEKYPTYNGYVVIRVYAEQFDSVLNGLAGIGEQVNLNIGSNDITDQYFDLESRLSVLEIEYEYLENYLKKLTNADDIFKTQMRLTEVRTQIESYTTNLERWKDLVELSTIRISIYEKRPDDMFDDAPVTYWDRLLDTMKDSFRGIFEALGDLLIFIIQAIPTLVILGIIIFVIWKIIKLLIAIRLKKNKPPVVNVNTETTEIKKEED